jgi:hypothetical protein
MRSKLPALSPSAELTLLRQKYPDGLYCTSAEPCPHRLLATATAGWAKSWAELPQHERLAGRNAYVCAECRHTAAERERVAQVRRDNALAALPAAREALQRVRLRAASETLDKTGDEGEGLYHSPTSPKSAEQGHHGSRGGRPRKHASDRAARAAAQRAYRQRRKAEQIAANDAALAA